MNLTLGLLYLITGSPTVRTFGFWFGGFTLLYAIAVVFFGGGYPR